MHLCGGALQSPRSWFNSRPGLQPSAPTKSGSKLRSVALAPFCLKCTVLSTKCVLIDLSQQRHPPEDFRTDRGYLLMIARAGRGVGVAPKRYIAPNISVSIVTFKSAVVANVAGEPSVVLHFPKSACIDSLDLFDAISTN